MKPEQMETLLQSSGFKLAGDSFRLGWQEAAAGETMPVSDLWEGIDDRHWIATPESGPGCRPENRHAAVRMHFKRGPLRVLTNGSTIHHNFKSSMSVVALPI